MIGRRGLAIVREHPRHLVLAALVVGLLAAAAGPVVILPAAAGVAALAGRARPAVLAAAALISGAVIADSRLSALDAGVLAAANGRMVESRAILLEPIRERAVGPAVARVRLLDGLGAGEQAVLRLRRSAYAGDLPPAPGQSLPRARRGGGRTYPIGGGNRLVRLPGGGR